MDSNDNAPLRQSTDQDCDDLLARERRARVQAEMATRARDEFLAIVSHELRAPLNGIQSWTHVLEYQVVEGGASPLAQRALNGIKTGIAQQVRLIEELLDVTRMMSGKLRLVKQPLAMLPVIRAAVDSVRAAAAARGIHLESSVTITAEQIDGDADRMQQIIWNLLSNAIKFTPEVGHVWISASRVGKRLCIVVRDSGVGLAPEFLPRLFDRFSQADTSSTRRHNGLGLGLFLVRHLVQLHGGQVEASSPGPGLGSSFTLWLPLRLDQHAAGSDSDARLLPLPSLSEVRVLVIDDQPEARDSLTALLTGAGAIAFPAASAQAAMTWLRTLSANNFPDILVCDIAMPCEDGYAVLQKIRRWTGADNSQPLQRIPALALTAFAQREDRLRALTAGFQMHVAKPVAAEELIVMIAALARRNAARNAATMTSLTDPPT
jgi:CheY-like chemotaxis protein/nitrogen-specific signal transduction histidine kinase